MSLPYRSASHQPRVVIIGNGIAGITAARHIRKLSEDSITVISSESKYFFSRTALMYVYMGHMRYRDIEPYESWFWEKNRIDLVHDHVLNINFEDKELTTAAGTVIRYDKLIIACGSASNMLDIPGIEAKNVQGLYSLQDLLQIESASADIRRAVIAGGGLIGIELAEMFHSRKVPVTFLIRESSFWNVVLPPEESQIINDHIREHDIDLQMNSQLNEIKKDPDGNVSSIITSDGKEIGCDFVGITIGVHPNISWLKESPLASNKGILVDAYLSTNIEDVYAIGDCVELISPPHSRNSIEPIWYTGRMMGEAVAHTITGKPTKYEPGFWFNSAKFFDIEYQVYGNIKPTLPSDQKTFFWRHMDNRKSLRINYHQDGEVLGFNLLGIRFRQEVCERWLEAKTNIVDVMKDLGLAFFEPEFSEYYLSSIHQQFTKETGIPINTKKKFGHDAVYRFLQKMKIKNPA